MGDRGRVLCLGVLAVPRDVSDLGVLMTAQDEFDVAPITEPSARPEVLASLMHLAADAPPRRRALTPLQLDEEIARATIEISKEDAVRLNRSAETAAAAWACALGAVFDGMLVEGISMPLARKCLGHGLAGMRERLCRLGVAPMRRGSS